MSRSQLSELSVSTATSFDSAELSVRHAPLTFALSIDDEEYTGEVTADGAKFEYNGIEMLFQSALFERQQYVYFIPSTHGNAEWSIVAQVRILTAGDGRALGLVDQDVFRFDERSGALTMEIIDDAVEEVKIHMRIINKLYLPYPKFDDGDLQVYFSDGSEPIFVHRHLLALYSEYMGKHCLHVEKLLVEIPKVQFIELLYQIYPTRRPVYAESRKLAAAANAYEVKPIIFALSKRLVEFKKRPMPLTKKFRMALDLLLQPALIELVHQATLSGEWDMLIRTGFEPEKFFTSEIYRKVVCPAVIKARREPLFSTTFETPFQRPDLLSEAAAANPSNSELLFYGTSFYVNSSLLKTLGASRFGVGSKGELVAICSKDFMQLCQFYKLLPGAVLESLLFMQYPGGEPVDYFFLRPAIVFCHDNGWTAVKENLEQLLLTEPPTSWQTYLEHLQFAHRYHLDNMTRVNLHRAEGSSYEMAMELARKPEFETLDIATRNALLHRLNYGWGLEKQRINSLANREPTEFVNREIGLGRGGPAGYRQFAEDATLATAFSDMYFGDPIELVQ